MDYPDYKPYEEGSAFQPVSVPDTATTLAKEYERQNAADQRNLKFVQQNNARRVEEAKKQGQNLQTLAKFSKTLTDQFVKQYKQNEDDRFTNEIYDDILNGVPEDVALAEAEEINAASQEASAVNDLATSVEEDTGDIAASQLVRDELGANAEAQVASRADLISAQASYPSFIQAWLASDNKITIGGQEMTVAQAVATGDPRLIQSAIALGRNQFIKQNNIRGARRTDVVRFLGRTILSTDAKVGAEAARQAVAADRKQRIEDLTGSTYNLAAQVDGTNSQEMWSSLADQYWESGLFPTRAAANEALLTDMLSRLVDDGNVEAIESLKDTLKTGEAGTELEKQYGKELAEAIQQAEDKRDGIQRQQVKDIMADMYAELNGVTGSDERAAIVERTAKRLEEAGRYQEARELRSDQAALSVEGASSRNAQIMSDQIRLGEITAPSLINEAYDRGEITQSQRDTLLSQLQSIKDAETPKNPQAEARVSEYTDRFASDALPLFGLQRDANGNVIDPVSGQTPVVTRGEFLIIEGAVKADLNRALNAVLQANPNLEGTQLDIELRRAAEEWYKTNVFTKGGKYYIGDLQDAFDTPSNRDDDKEANAAAANRFGSLIADPVAMAQVKGLPSEYRPRDLSLTMITPATAGQFNPIRGDKLFRRDALQRYRDEYEETGELAPYIQNVAELVGMTPLALFQQQLGAAGLPPVKPQLEATPEGDVTSARQGKNMLISLGVPSRGASWLSGNIQAESSWYGQRSWGQVANDGSDRNGGLVSWMDDADKDHWRLTRIEQQLGKPIDQASDGEQLQAMLWEMKTYYPKAYAVFMNPYATERQLIQASKEYWGYHPDYVGDRFTTARSLEALSNG